MTTTSDYDYFKHNIVSKITLLISSVLLFIVYPLLLLMGEEYAPLFLVGAIGIFTLGMAGSVYIKD